MQLSHPRNEDKPCPHINHDRNGEVFGPYPFERIGTYNPGEVFWACEEHWQIYLNWPYDWYKFDGSCCIQREINFNWTRVNL